MYLFLNSTYTWHSFVARMLLLLMIATVIVSPMPTPAGPSKKESYYEVQTFTIGVMVHRPGDLDSPESLWTLCVLSDPIQSKIVGYRTILQRSSEWGPMERTSKTSILAIAEVGSKPTSRVFVAIGTVFTEVIAKINDRRSGKLPNAASIFQVLMIFEKTLIEHKKDQHYTVVEYTFDLPKYQTMFEKMVQKKGTGAGFALSSEADMPWEWDMYNKIEAKKLNVTEMYRAKNAQVLDNMEFWRNPLELHNQLPAVPEPEETEIF
ncbi:hypothetical protein EV360DRAFT_68511 [Lentinula raphanica]|nr:hypothetical protein EV360DRAFT_68511 [Lentinula raphanica]